MPARAPPPAALTAPPPHRLGRQPRSGVEVKMTDKPIHMRETYQGSGKLQDKVGRHGAAGDLPATLDGPSQ